MATVARRFEGPARGCFKYMSTLTSPDNVPLSTVNLFLPSIYFLCSFSSFPTLLSSPFPSFAHFFLSSPHFPGTRSSGYHHSNHAHSNSHVVIHHTPLRDQKSWKGDGGRGGERGRGRSYGGFKSKEIEVRVLVSLLEQNSNANRNVWCNLTGVF